MKPYASPAGTASGDAVVYIVDDEPSITLALRSLLASVPQLHRKGEEVEEGPLEYEGTGLVEAEPGHLVYG